jgi:hypothetical protein
MAQHVTILWGEIIKLSSEGSSSPYNLNAKSLVRVILSVRVAGGASGVLLTGLVVSSSLQPTSTNKKWIISAETVIRVMDLITAPLSLGGVDVPEDTGWARAEFDKFSPG